MSSEQLPHTHSISPMHQFEIHKLISIDVAGFDLSITNATVWMILASLSLCFISYCITRSTKIVPNRFLYIFESIHGFILNLIKSQLGSDSRIYFPYIFPLFLFILFSNLFGLLPYSFTVTSHISVTLTLALLVFLSATTISIVKHKWGFFRTFFPKGLPLFIAPILIPVEIISFLSRPMSLAIRLCANMVAGHVLIKIFASFINFLSPSIIFFAVVPIFLNTLLTGFEVMVCVLQAYVFTILTCIYLNNALNLH